MASANDPFNDLVAVTPHDTNPQTGAPFRAFLVGGTGTVSLITRKGTTVSFTPIVGQVYHIRVSRFRATGTTATGILAVPETQ